MLDTSRSKREKGAIRKKKFHRGDWGKKGRSRTRHLTTATTYPERYRCPPLPSRFHPIEITTDEVAGRLIPAPSSSVRLQSILLRDVLSRVETSLKDPRPPSKPVLLGPGPKRNEVFQNDQTFRYNAWYTRMSRTFDYSRLFLRFDPVIT